MSDARDLSREDGDSVPVSLEFDDGESASTASKQLNLGCRDDYRDGWFNVDIDPSVDPDLVYDLNDQPWPWPDNSADRVLMANVLEHLNDRMATLEELHRVVKPTGTIVLRVPHWNSVGHYVDPTHTKTIDHRMFRHELVEPMFTVTDVSCERVRFGRLLPESVALLAADHIGHIVSSVEIILRNRPNDDF